MIATAVSDLGRYKGLGRHLDTAIDWVAGGGWNSRGVDGRLAIDGDNVYALYQRYFSRRPQEALFETHRAYIDIQFMLEGEELVEFRPYDGLEVAVPYVHDIEFQKVPADHSQQYHLQPGFAVVFFPEDAHRPALAVGGDPYPCRKVVVKVRIGND